MMYDSSAFVYVMNISTGSYLTLCYNSFFLTVI